MITTNPDCFDFDITTGTILHYDFENCPTDVLIPSKINNVTVEHINSGAFIKAIAQYCYDEEDNEILEDLDYNNLFEKKYEECGFDKEDWDTPDPITSVVFPTSLITIGDSAFDTTQLTTLQLNNLPNLTTIGDYAFYNNQLITLELKDLPNLITIGEEVFNYGYLNALTLDNIPGITIIKAWEFSNNRLTNLVLRNLPNLTTIGSYAFAFNQLTTLELNNLPNLTEIRNSSFKENQISNLKLENLPNLSTIEYSAFARNSLTNLDLRTLTNISYIERDAFCNYNYTYPAGIPEANVLLPPGKGYSDFYEAFRCNPDQ